MISSSEDNISSHEPLMPPSSEPIIFTAGEIDRRRMKNPPPGIRILQKSLFKSNVTEAERSFWYKLYVLVFTFACYTSYHLSRKPISVVKNVWHKCNTTTPHNINSSVIISSSQGSSECPDSWDPFGHPNYSELFSSLDYAFLFAYAFAMFLSGHLAERIDLRYFLTVGMILSGITTILMGIPYFFNIHLLVYFIAIQIIGGLVQSSGWPGVVTCVANWYGKGKRGFIMGVWNSHTSVGNILGTVIAGFWVENAWGWSFVVPGLIITVLGILVFFFLVPRPDDVDCPRPDHHPEGYISLPQSVSDNPTHHRRRNNDQGPHPRTATSSSTSSSSILPIDSDTTIPVSGPLLALISPSIQNHSSHPTHHHHHQLQHQNENFDPAQSTSPLSIRTDRGFSDGERLISRDSGLSSTKEDSTMLLQNSSEPTPPIDIVTTMTDDKSGEDSEMIDAGRSSSSGGGGGGGGEIERAQGRRGRRPRRNTQDMTVQTSFDRGHIDEYRPSSSSHSEEPISFLAALRIPGVIEFAICLFFAKLVSYTFLFWLPNYIHVRAKYGAQEAADLSTVFDFGGIFGGIVAGVISDYTGGRAAVCVAQLFLAAPMLFIYNEYAESSLPVNIVLLFILGSMVNGPYALITTAVSADLGTHSSLQGNARALSTVTAIIDGTGSMGAALGPLLTGLISSIDEEYGWDYVFDMLIIADVIALICLIRLTVKEIKEMWREWKDWRQSRRGFQHIE